MGYWTDRDTGDERDTDDPRYCPPNAVRIWWPTGYTVADPATLAEFRRLRAMAVAGDQLEAEAATLRAHLLALGLAARDYLACYPEGRQHGRDGKRLAEALMTALRGAGL